MGFPHGPAGKESTCNVGDQGLIPGLGRSPGEGKGYPHQYSGLENFMNCILHGVKVEHDWATFTYLLTPFYIKDLCILRFWSHWCSGKWWLWGLLELIPLGYWQVTIILHFKRQINKGGKVLGLSSQLPHFISKFGQVTYLYSASFFIWKISIKEHQVSKGPCEH